MTDPDSSQSSSKQDTTQTMRKRVKRLLIEGQAACLRPLFSEISNGWTADRPNIKRAKLTSDPRKWETILAESSKLLPFMTPDEHALISKCASIYLLGFLNPTSTGSDFFTLRSSEDSTSFFDMELEERLENTSRFFQANEFGQVNVCTDVNRERGFQSFLKEGLTPFLNRRPAHPQQTDLLHLIALAIAPQVNTDGIGTIVAPFLEKQVPAWEKTHRLMTSLHAHSFALSHSHRLQFVRLVAEELVLPQTDATQIMAGAIPHLLASLQTFGWHLARSVSDAHLANQGLVRVTTQTGQEYMVREIFYSLLSQTIEDSNKCNCPNFCPHAARGRLLRHCVLTFNVARHYADARFTQQAFMALSHSIEEEISPWLVGSDEDPKGPCLLSSLLSTAEALFYFILEEDEVDTSGLLEMSIQLLQHQDEKIRDSAASLLSVASAYMSPSAFNQLANPLFQSFQVALETKLMPPGDKILEFRCMKSLEQSIAISSRKSAPFAVTILHHLIQQRRTEKWKSADHKEDAKIAECVGRLISTVSAANATAAFQKSEDIQGLFAIESTQVAKSHLIAALVSTRQAFAFGKERTATDSMIWNFTTEMKDGWKTFKLARHALATGEFAVAQSILTNLTSCALSEQSFLWMSGLSKVAEAESTLTKAGSNGLPTACVLMESALSFIESISLKQNQSMSFQVEFLRLRLDFFDLAAATRLISRETRLNGTVAKITTRVGLHLTNILKSWGSLASSYYSLYKRHGVVLCPQSRSCLRTMHSICSQIREVGSKLFSEPSNSKNKHDPKRKGPRGDALHPTICLLRQIKDEILPSMDKLVEPAVRATTLVEMLEAVHRSPIPFPRCFTRTKKIPSASLRISLDPSQQHARVSHEDLDVIDLPQNSDSTTIYPGMNTTVFASGSIPESILRDATVPFSCLLLWSTVRFISTLQGSYVDDEEEANTQDASGGYNAEEGDIPPIQISLPTSNKFVVSLTLPPIRTSGIYRIDYQLGCRDIGCGEWQLPLRASGNSILVRVSRRLESIG